MTDPLALADELEALAHALAEEPPGDEAYEALDDAFRNNIPAIIRFLRAWAEQHKALVKVQREQQAEKGTDRPCLFCYEAEHVEDCPGSEVDACIAAWREAGG